MLHIISAVLTEIYCQCSLKRINNNNKMLRL